MLATVNQVAEQEEERERKTTKFRLQHCVECTQCGDADFKLGGMCEMHTIELEQSLIPPKILTEESDTDQFKRQLQEEYNQAVKVALWKAEQNRVNTFQMY